ncbi:MAG TPA: adenylate/guanylate cyclase domain-containing protein [Candidatus Cybelea sp.]
MPSEPPTGLVAFLFTDVEASTRRWERYGDAMRAALRRHDEILRAEIESHRGYVFKTIGDAFCAAFPSVIDAVGAAVEAQRRLQREDFTTVDGLDVRMAINAGETDERDGDYFGAAVNRTARLLSAGHGAQVLLSGEAADMALAQLPNDISLRHLGVLPLRDIKDAERVFQPVGKGLRSDFKPLRALQTPPNNLPRQTTRFVGRHDDIARVEAILDESSLVTIVGAGGIGKTRLALEIAVARLNDLRDGAWFVDLSAVGDAALIPVTILSALGGECPPAVKPIDALLGYLAKRELLLVLDNSEHLVSEVASIVAQVIARSPHASVLATSRSPLDITGERLYRLASLETADALELFADRARAANAAFDFESKAVVVEAICNRLDGIALAIELAAARVRTMSVETLASHLELRLLSGGRDRRPRQQTMRALIDWSYDLLTGDDARVLRRVAVFLRGFTLGAAARVCADVADGEARVLELLASLVDQSLVIQSEGTDERYRILEPIREYGWEKLSESGELASTRALHAAAMATLAAQWYDEWDTGPRGDWLTRVEHDLANVRAALRWSIEESSDLELGARLLADATIVFLRLALLSEGVGWGERVLGSGVQIPPEVEARLRYGLSMLYSNIGQNKKCLEEAEFAVALYRQTGDRRGLARALSQVASRHAPHASAEAKKLAQEALSLARAIADRRLLADVLRRCALCFAGDGTERVRSAFAESVALFRALGRDDDTARALTWWGQWEEEAGNYADAVERLTEAACLDDAAAVFHAHEIASCYLAMDDHARAEPFARKSLVAAAKARHRVGTSLTISHLAIVAGKRNAEVAALLLGYAQARLREEGWELMPPESTLVPSLIADLRSRLGEDKLARLLDEGAAWSDDQALSRAFAS